MKYIEKQIGWIVIASISGIFLLLLLSYIYQWGNNPISFIGLLISSSILLISLLLFFQMTTSIKNEQLEISFGIGLIRKKIAIKNIEHVEFVRNKWIDGIGIHKIKNGWLYSIKGLNAIEIKIKNSRSIVRIGTSDGEKLKKEIGF